MKRFVVIGLGNFGFYVAKTLFELGNEVIAIDVEREKVQEVGEYCNEAIVLDATERDRLEVLGLDEMNCAIVSTGDNMKNSIVICLHLKELGLKKIVAKANDTDHAKILRLVGATDIIHPEKDMAIKVARDLAFPNMLDYVPLGKDFSIVEIDPPASFIGKTLIDLNLRAKYHVYIIAIKNTTSDDFTLLPNATYEIQNTDILYALGSMKDLNAIREVEQ